MSFMEEIVWKKFVNFPIFHKPPTIEIRIHDTALAVLQTNPLKSNDKYSSIPGESRIFNDRSEVEIESETNSDDQ